MFSVSGGQVDGLLVILILHVCLVMLSTTIRLNGCSFPSDWDNVYSTSVESVPHTEEFSSLPRIRLVYND